MVERLKEYVPSKLNNNGKKKGGTRGKGIKGGKESYRVKRGEGETRDQGEI